MPPTIPPIAIICQGNHSAGWVGDGSDIIPHIVGNSDHVAIGIRDGVAVQVGFVVVFHLTLFGECVGVVHVFHQLIKDAGGSSVRTIHILMKLVGKVISPVRGEVARTIRNSIQVEAVRNSSVLV